VVSKFELPETVRNDTQQQNCLKAPLVSEKMTVLSSFLESPLNFLSNYTKNTSKSHKIRKKNDIKV